MPPPGPGRPDGRSGDEPTRLDLPESQRYRLKRRLLGSPLHTKQLALERLGKPTALAVFASDNLSSSAYATEEILRVLIPVIGVAPFSLVVPVTTALLVVLGFLILSYRQTIKEYPSAGGAYIVTKDNFGKVPALVAGVSLLTDYVLTVAVSVAAGTAAMASAIPALQSFVVPISLAFIALIAFGMGRRRRRAAARTAPAAAQPAVRGRVRRAAPRRAPSAGRSHPAPARGDHPGRPARPGRGPGHPLGPQPDTRRAAGRPVRARHDPCRELRHAWTDLGLSRLPLDIIEFPDRRLTRAAVDLVAEALADGDTEVTVLLPRLEYDRSWHRLLHDRTARSLASALADVPHASVTFIPYHLGGGRRARPTASQRKDHRATDGPPVMPSGVVAPADAVAIGGLHHRDRATLAGRVRQVRVQPRACVATLQVILTDGTGDLQVVFLGRRQIVGIEPGTFMSVSGVVGQHGGLREMLNPAYQLLAVL